MQGVAISVSLLPPLAVAGIALAFINWPLAIGAFSLFVLNLLGIIFAALVVFAVFRFYEVREKIDKKIRAEERIIKDERKEKEIEKIEEIERAVKEAAELIKETKK